MVKVRLTLPHPDALEALLALQNCSCDRTSFGGNMGFQALSAWRLRALIIGSGQNCPKTPPISRYQGQIECQEANM